LLAELSIVDTPGTNAVIRQHEALTTHFIPRADLVLFVTSADRPFTESERAFMAQIRDWGKKVVLILTKLICCRSAETNNWSIRPGKCPQFAGQHSSNLPVQRKVGSAGKKWRTAILAGKWV
jgi:predicted GTPase